MSVCLFLNVMMSLQISNIKKKFVHLCSYTINIVRVLKINLLKDRLEAKSPIKGHMNKLCNEC